MTQVFHPRLTLILKGVALATLVTVIVAIAIYRGATQPATARLAAVEQPIPFSHKHHAGDDGIDCRYCHASVETSAFAGIPALSTCKTCHSQLFTDAPVLAPLFERAGAGAALAWNRVHDLPDFVYFNHGIHISKGIGCSSCHGAVDEMPLTWRTASLEMQWCLDCHRDPVRYLRPRDRVFDMKWTPPSDQRELGARLAIAYHIRTVRELTDCSTCHR